MPSRALSLALLFCLACTLLVACQNGQQLNTQPSTVTTICPPAGTTRPAVMPSLTPGKHLAQVYYTTDTPTYDSLLEHVDPTSHVVTQIARVHNAHIIAAQSSSDGQWLIFALLISAPHAHIEWRLMRIDGQYEQTLYCASTANRASQEYTNDGTFAWSPDMTSVALLEVSASSSLPVITRLDLSQGSVQTLIASVLQTKETATPATFVMSEIYYPLKWLDNTHLYLVGQQHSSGGSYQNYVYLLDSSKGAYQQRSDLQRVLNGGDMTNGPSYCDFDSSPDGSQFYVARCTRNDGSVQAQGSITVQPATGGQPRTIFSTHAFSIVGIRAISPHTLLLLTNAHNDSGYAGSDLWKINSDGTGLTHLASEYRMFWCSIENTQCVNASPDGSHYGLAGFDANDSDQLLAGSLSGKQAGAVIRLTPLYDGFIGWTMI